jgi:sensor histidine kinase YesM
MISAGHRVTLLARRALAGIDDPRRGSGTSILLFALLLSGALFAYQFIVEWSYRITYQQVGFHVLRELITDSTFAFAVTLGFSATARLPARDRLTSAPYVLTVILGAAGAGVVDGVLTRLRFPNLWQTGIVFMRGTYVMFSMLLLGSIGLFVYLDRVRARSALARLRGAELERAVAAKRVLGSRLQAMQARVEPQFLFNTLGQVRRLYGQDPGQARRMLDDLIAYLRAAMPQMRSATSTVGQEVALARAYLGVLAASLDYPLDYAIEVDDVLTGIPFPPMVLLPLIDHALARRAGEDVGGRTVRIAGSAVAGRLRILVIDSDAGFASASETAAIAALRERLHVLYGDDARLALSTPAGSDSRADIEVSDDPNATSATVDAAFAARPGS